MLYWVYGESDSQTIPRTLVKYEDVQKKTKEDTKQANRASRYDDYYDEEDYY